MKKKSSVTLAENSTHKLNPPQKDAFRLGLKDGIPIGAGYLAVSFSLGITARNAGLTAFQGFIASLFTNASAGEYAVFSLIAASASYWEVILISLIANARYLLMSCALSQKLSPKTPLYKRLMIGFCITDEVFGVSVSKPLYLNPTYTFGAFLVAWPCWALGTTFGVIAGNILPVQAVSALSVALYGMFLAVIIPPARQNKVVCILIITSFIVSFIATYAPILSSMADGIRTIILTVAISVFAAIVFPVTKDGKESSADGT